MEIVIQDLKKIPDRHFKSEKFALTQKRKGVISVAKKGLSSRAELGNQDRFLKNISLAKVWLKATDSALSQLSDFILRVKKITIRMRDETYNHETRKQATKEIEKLFVKILETANSQDMESHVSLWKQPMTFPFRKEERGPRLQGDIEKMELEIEPGSNMRINLVDSNFLTKPLRTLGENFDLNPGIDPNTRLSDLNLGRGVNLGSIRVNNAGMSWDINLSRVTEVGEVINAINSSEIARILCLETGLSADISASKKGLKLTYTGFDESDSGQEFTISEATGTTARDLGILTDHLGESANQFGSFEGQDLNPILTEKTPTSLLKSGQKPTLGTIRIALGETQSIVDLSSASTLGEIIDAINNSMPGVVASLNNLKKGISVESTAAGKSLVFSDADDKKSACRLGISGSPDILGTLLFLMNALNNKDGEVISEGLETLNLGLEKISSHLMEVDAKLKRLNNIEARIMGFQPDTTQLLSKINRVDLSRVTTDLENEHFIFRSALKRGTAMMQPALLNFIR